VVLNESTVSGLGLRRRSDVELSAVLNPAAAGSAEKLFLTELSAVLNPAVSASVETLFDGAVCGSEPGGVGIRRDSV